MQPAKTLRGLLSSRRHTALLVAIVVTFAVRPLFGDSDRALIVFSCAIMLLLLLAVYTTQVDELLGDRDVLLAQRRRRHVWVWALAVPVLLERFHVILAPTSRLYLASSICWLLFFAFITWSQLRTLLKHREVTSETIAMSMSVYLLLGLTWGMLYIGIFQLHPDAFSFGGASARLDQQHYFPVFIYFSLTTLSTIGFGDIVPLTLQARYAAVAEGITGQFYLAILVARLVGMHMSRDVRTRSE
jgi:voltage-gated potassium channel